MSRRPKTLACALLAVSLSATAAGGCGTTTVAKEGSGSTDTAAALDEGGASFRSNQRRLTRAQSLKLVAWATSFRQCMVADGGKLGPLVTDASEIAMKLPAAVRIESLLRRMEMCGERQGGPPRRASLQYRPGKIVLYLPKQCLLDKKVARS